MQMDNNQTPSDVLDDNGTTSGITQTQKGNNQGKKRRNIWTLEEIHYFLTLIKEKQVLGLMDGKRIRVSDIFKTLIAPMRERGYIRDVNQLIVKYKNLKADYYRCKRHNSISGNDPMTCDFYDELNEILGDRPLSQVDGSLGYESIASIPVVDENDPDVANNTVSVDVEIIEDVLDVDRETPRSSKSSDSAPKSSKNFELKKKKVSSRDDASLKQQEKFFEQLNAIRKEEAQANRELMENIATRSEQTMINCTKFFLSGLQKIFTNKKIEEAIESDEEV